MTTEMCNEMTIQSPNTVIFHPTYLWNNYLLNEYQNYLFDIIKCAQEGRRYDKMILMVGPGRNGKTTLLKQIADYIGGDDVICSSLDFHEKPFRKMVMLDGLVNELQEGESLSKFCDILNSRKENIIGTTNKLDSVHPEIVKRCKIVRIYHTF